MSKWLAENVKGKPVFVGFNAVFDFKFVDWLFQTIAGVAIIIAVSFCAFMMAYVTLELELLPKWRRRFIGTNIEFEARNSNTIDASSTVMYSPVIRPDIIGLGREATKVYQDSGEIGIIAGFSAETLHPVLKKTGSQSASNAIDDLDLHCLVFGEIGINGLINKRLDDLIRTSELKRKVY